MESISYRIDEAKKTLELYEEIVYLQKKLIIELESRKEAVDTEYDKDSGYCRNESYTTI